MLCIVTTPFAIAGYEHNSENAVYLTRNSSTTSSDNPMGNANLIAGNSFTTTSATCISRLDVRLSGAFGSPTSDLNACFLDTSGTSEPVNVVCMEGVVATVAFANITTGNEYNRFEFNPCVSLNASTIYAFKINESTNDGTSNYYTYTLDTGNYAGGKEYYDIDLTPAWLDTGAGTYDFHFSLRNSSEAPAAPSNNPPVINVTQPLNGTNATGTLVVNWTVIEVENMYLVNVTIKNSSDFFTIEADVPSDRTGVSYSLNGFGAGEYTINATVFETNGSELFTSSDSAKINISVPDMITPSITLHYPADGASFNVTTVFFNFSQDASGSNCSIIVNSEVLQNFTNVDTTVQMSSSFPFGDPSNNSWFVSCTYDFNSNSSTKYFSVDTSTPYIPYNSTLIVGGCPSTLEESSMVWLFIVIALVLLFIGIAYKVPITTLFSGIIFLVMSMYIASCTALMMGVLAGLGAILCFYAAVQYDQNSS